jgi:two-component system, sensor histidine kinase and response regulator
MASAGTVAAALGTACLFDFAPSYAAALSHGLALVAGATAALGLALRLTARRSESSAPAALFDNHSLQHVRGAAKAAGIRIFEWDIRGGRLIADRDELSVYSDAAQAALGNPREFVRLIIHPDDLEHYTREMAAAIANKTHFAIAYRALRRDGTICPVRIHAEVVRDDRGRAIRMHGLTLDMSAQADAMQRIEQQAQDQRRTIERLDRAQAELEAQAKQQSILIERLNLATRVGGIGVWDWDVESDSMTVDQSIARAYGIDSLKIERDALAFCTRTVAADDVPSFTAAIKQGLESGRLLSHRHRIVLADGTTRHVQFQSLVFRNAEGKATRLLGVTIDVTAEVERNEQLQRRAEEERALRDRLNLATETAGIGVWDVDLTTRGISADANTYELMGVQPPLDEERLRKLVHPDDAAAVWGALAAAINDAAHVGIVSTRHRIVRSDGETRHVQTHMRMFRDAQARPARIMGVTWDVTAEVEHAQRVEGHAAHVQSLLHRIGVASKAAGISTWELDLATHKYVWVENRPVAYGLEHVPLVEYGDGVRKLIHPEDLGEITEVMAAAVASAQSTCSYRFRIRRPDGTERHMQSYVHCVRDEGGRAIRFLGATTDITNEVQTTALLQRQAAQERALSDRLAIATEAANIGTWEIDLVERKYLWVENPLKGLEDALVADAPLEGYTKYVHPDDRKVLPDALQEALTGGSDRISCRYRAVRKDGSVLHVQVYGRLLPNANGEMTRLLGVSWDITSEFVAAQKLEERARHERMLLARLSMATDAAGICSWEIDLGANRFLWTENWLQSLGDTRPEISTPTNAFVAARLHPDDRGLFTKAISDALRAKHERFSLRYRAIDAQGGVVYVQSHARFMKDEQGWARSLLGVSSDVTGEVEAAQRLEDQARQQEVLLERLKLSSEAAGICSFEVDMERGCFLWSENPIRSLTEMNMRGVSIEQFADMVIVAEDRNVFRSSARQALKERRNSYSFRYRGLGKDGRIVHVENHAHFVLDQKTGRAVRLLGVSWDVTSNVEAAEKLERQTVQQRVLLDRLSVATQVADISSWEIDLTVPEFLWIENPIATLVYPGDEDYTIAALQARIHPDDRSALEEKIIEAVRTGGDRVTYRYRGFGVDGRTVHVQNFVKLVFDANKRPISALGASWDITKEIEAAEQLAQQAEQLRVAERRLERASLLSSEGHWESDLINRLVWYSSSYHALLGYREGELPQRFDEFLRLIHADDLATSEAALRQHIDSGTPFVIDARMRCGTGEFRWFRQRGSAERDASGAAITMSGSIHDIHEQKLAETALQLAQLRFERAINGTQDGLWELEANGNAWCSPRLGELLGHTANEFPANTNFLRECLHPDDAAAVAVATQAHFQQEHPYDVEIRLRTKSGDYRWYRARAKAERDAQGKPLRMSGSLQDVTEARAAREALVQATAAAEAASEAKSSFLANVSHEIRTPMNGIIGMTGLLLDTALDRTQRDYAETIRGSADSLLIVINDILDFSKIEAGKLDIEAIELDLRGNVEDVGGMMAFQAAAKNLELVVHVHPDVPDRVISDPQRIRQCLINLVGNAIKFTRSGEIVIEVSTIGRRDGKVLTQFQVRDTGIGIAPETLQTLFQPFVQADASTTRHFGGTGLGLSIVRRLVEMMDGAVGIESEVGKGSTFWFTLPLEPAASAAQPRPLELHRLGRRVLIVDDHETNRRVLAGQLIHAGFEVSLAKTGSEALQLLRLGGTDNHPYDIVLADHQMDDMDGAALGEHIKADAQLASARIVILTSLDRHGDIRRFASLGFAGYLTKPIRARELFECMDRVLACEAKEWHLQSQPIITRGTLVSDEALRRYEGHVLLVEDNPVNQKVAVRFLERMGCHVRIADNGAEAVKAYQEGRFDLILMDLQMPVMDGLMATRRIREIENGQRMTPIVALTANAMSGQINLCMEAGMNAFLTKPLEIARLHETLELYGLATQPSESITGAAHSTGTPVNLARLNEITDGDAEFAYELASTFVSSGEQVFEELQAALDSADRNALTRAAHKLKGASANIHADSLRDLAYALETQAAKVDQPRLKELVRELRESFDVAAEFLREQSPQPAAKAG